jgi:TniQ protein
MHVRNLGHPGPPPLPLRVQPLPWESLASVLCRAARRMGYEQPKWLLQPENSSYRLREEYLPWLCRKEDFLYLERLLYLDEETLYLTTLHRFASLFQDETDPPARQNASLIGRPLLSRRSYFRTSLSVRVCLACLDQQASYDHLHWQAEFIVLCPSHALPLRTNCPYCKMRIPSVRAELRRCPFCRRGDYRVPTACGPEDSLLFQGELLLLRSLGVALPPL